MSDSTYIRLSPAEERKRFLSQTQERGENRLQAADHEAWPEDTQLQEGFPTRVFRLAEESHRGVRHVIDKGNDEMYWCSTAIAKFIAKLPYCFLGPCRICSVCLSLALLALYVWSCYIFFQHDIYVLNSSQSVYGEANLLINDKCDLTQLLQSPPFCQFYGTSTCNRHPLSVASNATTSVPTSAPTFFPTNSSNHTNSSTTSLSPTNPTQTPIVIASFLTPVQIQQVWWIRIETIASFFIWLFIRQKMFVLAPKKMSFAYLLLTLLNNAVSWSFRHWGIVEKSPCSVIFSVHYGEVFLSAIPTFVGALFVYILFVYVFTEIENKGKKNERLILKKRCGGKYIDPTPQKPRGDSDLGSKCVVILATLLQGYAFVVPAVWLGVTNLYLSMVSKKKTKLPLTVVNWLVFAIDRILVFPKHGVNTFTLAACVQGLITVMDGCIFVLSCIYEKTDVGRRLVNN